MRRLLLALAASIPAAILLSAAPGARGDVRPPDALNAAELRVALHRLEVMGSVLYVGAHPDDDNTSVLACLARQRLVRTAYLSLTRGDGGQNILGAEAGDALGVLRTQELLASRRIDGAEQFFARALDYGFSKSPDEALSFWGHDRALADVVWIIRRFHPDVIVTRFGTDGSGGHGHHTASAILAGEAFRAAADSARFPEQLKYVRPWQAKRLLWNNWSPKLEGRDAASPSIVTLDVGAYDPELGLAYSEIGGRARSLNRSQGAGTRERRGAVTEYFQHVGGDPAQGDLFDGVDLTWSRVPGGPVVDALLHEAERRFDPDHPAAILPILARAHVAMSGLPPDPLVTSKLRDLERVMRSCAGLWLEAIAETPTVSPGDTLRVTVTAIDRGAESATLARVLLPFGARAFYAIPAKPTTGPPSSPPAAPRLDPASPADSVPRALAVNQPVIAQGRVALPADAAMTQPYWLRQPPLKGSFEVSDQRLIGDAEDAPAIVARITVELAGEPVTFEVPVAYRWNDRVYGDRYRAIEVVPPVTCQFDQGVYLFTDTRPREVRLAVQSTSAPLQGAARLRLPTGWSAEPRQVPVRLDAGAEQEVRFQVTAGPGSPAATLGAEIEVGGGRYSSRLVRIDYPHVPIQLLLPSCEARLVHTDLKHTGARIAYLMGPGDAVPDALRQMGYDVTLLGDDDAESADLSRFHCIVTGVRAYNTRPRLRVLQPRLLDYVKNGGRLVVQYCTNEEALNDRLGPWPFKITRDRVTVEEAEMRLLAPRHPLLHVPNTITARDFEGWVQERGLNYSNPWDPRYQTLLSANDPGEPPLDGGVLYAKYGQGVFIYTALAFFRQLPAGVPGAWRLFANLVSPELPSAPRRGRAAAASKR
jgi:LmbE family N-acetylglucosaminyl deacetylase